MSTPSQPEQGPPPDKNVSLFICLSFFPSEYLVSAVSQLVSDFCQIGLRDLDISSRFHMAAHELAENITKYSTASRVSLEVELSETDGVHTLSVRTKNEASPDRLAEVEKRLEELKTTKDPVGLYDRMIEESAPLEGVSGLGLARIRAEGGLDFDYRINGNELTLVVQAPVPAPPPFGPSDRVRIEKLPERPEPGVGNR
jgi:hypothetical protein